MRCYLGNQFMPPRNQLLDAGAAGQNLVLAAHAVGLEGVWLTLTEAITERLKNRFQLPEAVRPVTYVDVGYGDQTPFPPLRWAVSDTVLARV
jgi:nitroreductase